MPLQPRAPEARPQQRVVPLPPSPPSAQNHSYSWPCRYIKELADRIHSIENKLESEGNMSQDDIDKLFASERPRSHSQLGAVDDSSRKRPFSSISTTTEFTTPLTATRPPPWGSELRPLQPAPVTSEAFASQYAGSNGALAPQPVVAKADGTPSKPPVATMDAPMTDADELPDVDEAALDEYVTCSSPGRQAANRRQLPRLSPAALPHLAQQRVSSPGTVGAVPAVPANSLFHRPQVCGPGRARGCRACRQAAA